MSDEQETPDQPKPVRGYREHAEARKVGMLSRLTEACGMRHIKHSQNSKLMALIDAIGADADPDAAIARALAAVKNEG